MPVVPGGRRPTREARCMIVNSRRGQGDDARAPFSLPLTLPFHAVSHLGKPMSVPYVYDDFAPMPPAPDEDALEILARCRNKAAVKELEAAIAVLDGAVKTRFQGLGNLKSIRSAFQGLTDVLDRRRAYLSRLAGLRRALKMPASKLPDTPVLPNLVNVGDHDTRPGDLQRHIASQVAIARKALTEVDRDIATWEAIASQDERYFAERVSLDPHPLPSKEEQQKLGGAGQVAYNNRRLSLQRMWPQDAVMERLVKYATIRRELIGRIAALEADAAASTTLVARKVKAAVDQAGGESAVILASVAADAVTNLIPPSIVRTLEAMKAETESALSRLASAGVTSGPAVDQAKAKLADVVGQLATAQQESCDRRRAVGAAIVERAIAGDEAARAQLERLATQYPVAFAPGFLSAIAAARWDHAAFAEIVATIPA